MAAPSSGTVSDAESGPGRLASPGRAVEDLARLDNRELLGIVRSLPRASDRRAAACDLLVTRHQRLVRSCVRPYLRGPEPLLAEEVQAPEFNQFTVEMCRAVGFTPTVYGGPWKASARPPTWSPRDAACTASPPPASPRSPGPSGGRSPNRPRTTVVGAVARDRDLRPRARRRQLHAGDVAAARLAGDRRPGGALTGPHILSFRRHASCRHRRAER